MSVEWIQYYEGHLYLLPPQEYTNGGSMYIGMIFHLNYKLLLILTVLCQTGIPIEKSPYSPKPPTI